MHNRRLIGIALGSLFLVLGATACSDDTKTTAKASSAGGTTTTAPEDKVTADAEVATGLKKMVEAAKAANYEEAHEAWEEVEGTVKAKEPDLYATMEEDLALLKAAGGDSTKATAASVALSGHVDAYLAKYPG